MLPATSRLTFRHFTMDDVDLLTDLDSDPEVMRHLTMGRPTPRENYVNEIIPRLLKMYETLPGRGFFAAILSPSPTPDASTPHAASFLGWFHLKPGHYWPHQLEIGYRLRREHWNRGYASEGTRALIDYSFTTLSKPAVIATTLLANTASQRVMEKSGMTREVEFTELRWPGDDKRAVKYIIHR